MQEEGVPSAAPPIGSLEAVVEEQAAAEGAARQARVCNYPVLFLTEQETLTSCLDFPQPRSPVPHPPPGRPPLPHLPNCIRLGQRSF